MDPHSDILMYFAVKSVVYHFQSYQTTSTQRSQSRPSTSTLTRSSVNLRNGGGVDEVDSSERRRSRSGTLERRKTISSYDDMMGNRDGSSAQRSFDPCFN